MTDRDQKSSAQPASSSDASKPNPAPAAAAPTRTHDVDAKDTARSGAARPRGQTEDPDRTL